MDVRCKNIIGLTLLITVSIILLSNHPSVVTLPGISSLGTFHTMDDVLGLPLVSSYPSNWEMGNFTGHHLSLWKRITNFIIQVRNLYDYQTELIPTHDQIARKHLGNHIPPVEKIIKNVSLVLLNHHEVLQYPKLLMGKVITVGGIQTSQSVIQRVPSDLQKFMDTSTDGFIYVSFGSNAESKNLPQHIKHMLLKVFTNLRHRIVWKYEDKTLSSLPSHIFISKWMPQRAILGHPNIKLFFYQGGLQSSEEAIANGVPLVGLPVLADQDNMINRFIEIGIARGLELTALTEQDLEEALKDVLHNKSYKENALKAQRFFKDRPYDDLQHAMWWIEYVIRNKGTPYHYYSLTDDPWYSRYNEDVIATLAIIIFVMACLVAIVLVKSARFCWRIIKQSKAPEGKLKNN